MHAFLWVVVAGVFVWSLFDCNDRFTWFLEVFPVLLGTGILLAVYKTFQLTRLVAWMLCLHAIVLIVGGHYTYAEVPLFNWIRDIFHLKRNYYDRLGHFMQGFVPALIAREILIRKNVLKPSKWLGFIVLSLCLAFSATYELFEAIVAIAIGVQSDAFLGTQGDPWDTQWDMAFALIGATAALAFFSRWHDRELKRMAQ